MAKKSKAARVIFRDALGRFVKATERYTKKAVSAQVKRGGRYVTIVEHGDITPRKLVDLVTREEFEALPATYGEALDVEVEARKKYKAWEIAGDIVSQRGVKGKRLKVTMHFSHGRQQRDLTLFFQPKKDSTKIKNQTALFSNMVRALGMEGYAEYDRIGSRFLEDRRGSIKIKLKGATIEKML